MNRHDTLVKALEGRGCFRVAASTQKYTVLTRPGGKAGGMTYYYVGKSGALRTGRTVADSISLTDTAWYNMIVKGRPA